MGDDPESVLIRLRSHASDSDCSAPFLMEDAAELIESLRASLTRAEAEREELTADILSAIEPWVRHANAVRGEKGLTISTLRGYRDVPHEDLEALFALKARLSRDDGESGT